MVSADPTVVEARQSEEFGNGVIGSISSATKRIFRVMWIISTSTRSNTAWCRAWQIGRIRHFIDLYKQAFCRWIGRVKREQSWNAGSGGFLIDGYRYAQPILRGLQ